MLLIGLLIALGQAAAGESGPQRTVRGSCPALEITSAQVPAARRGRIPSFAATQIVELEIAALLPPAPARGALRFRVMAPGGFLYQTLDARLVSRVRGRHRVAARLPVAGTLITSNGLYGKWTVEPWLDDLSAPCGPSQAFVILE